jgi:type IV pilus assembly protein PilF
MSVPAKSARLLACALAVWLSGCAQGVTGAGASSRSAAYVDLETASDESPNQRRARIRLELATAYFQQGQTHVALDEVKQAIAIDPDYADAYNLRGLVYLRLNDLPLASHSFDRALALNPSDADAAHNYAWLLCQHAQYEASEKLFARAIANPAYTHSAKSWMTQGLCQLRSGQIGAAEISLTRSHALDGTHPVTRYNLARLLYDRGDYESAQPYMRKLNKSPLANAETLWLGIQIEQQLKNTVAAEVLAVQLRGRFAQSRELIAYEKEAVHD